MKKLGLLFLFLLAFSAPAWSQNYVNFNADNVENIQGQNIASGNVCVQATARNGVPITFQVGGGGQVITSAVCRPILNGVISQPFQVANPLNTAPANILYDITVRQNGIVVIHETLVNICAQTGACTSPYSFDFDTCITTGACRANSIPASFIPTPGPAGATGATGAAGATGPAGPINTIAENGSDLTVQPKLNLISGTNATVDCVNNGGASRTDCTIDATAGGKGILWSSAVTYSAGDVVTFGTNLDTYTSLAGSNSNFSPNYNPTKWRKNSPVYYDIDNYGARPLGTNIYGFSYWSGYTCDATSGSPNITIAPNGSIFQVGDGIACYGAGAENTMSTPSAPTIVNKLAALGLGTGRVADPRSGDATTRNYKVFAMNAGGGVTAASSVGTITTGNSALGQKVTAASTTMARSGRTVTATTAAAHIIASGGEIEVQSCSDLSFNGHYIATGSADDTHFTFNQPVDTKAGASASATGCVVYYFVADHITWSAVTGAWMYGICLDVGGGTYNIVGWSRPHGASVSELFFDYWGTMSANPWVPLWVPTSCPSAETDDVLVSTIITDGGTSLTLANNAGNNVTGGRVVFDNTPAIVAADLAARTSGGVVYIPSTGTGQNNYILGSSLSLGAGSTLRQSGQLYTFNTIRLTQATKWLGWLDASGFGAAQFGYAPGAQVACDASPCVYLYSANASHITGMKYSWQGTNNAVVFVIDASSDLKMSFVDIATGSTDADDMGIALVFRSPGDTHQNTLEYMRITSGPNQTQGKSWTPNIFSTGTVGNTHLGPEIYINRRGIVWASSSSYLTTERVHTQGFITPYISIEATSGTYRIKDTIMDTTGACVFASLIANGVSPFAGDLDIDNSPTSIAGQPALCGTHVAGLTSSNSQGGLVGQNFGLFQNYSRRLHLPVWAPAPLFTNSAGPLSAGGYVARGPMDFPAQHAIYFSYGFKPTISSVTSEAGGSLTPSTTYTYQVYAVDHLGGEGAPSDPLGVTIDGGEGTARITWLGVVGAAKYTVRRLNAGNYNCRVAVQVAALTIDDTGAGLECSVQAPDGAGGGPTSVSVTEVVTPKVIQVTALNASGLSDKVETTAPVTGTNRTVVRPTISTNESAAAVRTSNYTNATTTPSDITGLAFPVLASSNYTMRCELIYSASAVTAGLDIAITGPASPTSLWYTYEESDGLSTSLQSTATSFGTKLIGNTVVTGSTNLKAVVTMGLRNGSNAGTVQVQGSATGTGTVTVLAGSYCQLQ